MTYTDLLAPRRSIGRPSSSAPRNTAEWAPVLPPAQERLVTIHCAGTDFLARYSMATIFLRQALEIVAENGSGLVPLLHAGGVDLLLITSVTAVACRYDGWTLTDIHNLRVEPTPEYVES